MPTRAMRLKTQARVLACLQAVCLTLSVVKEQSLFASLMRLEKELFPLYLRQGECPKGRGGMILTHHPLATSRAILHETKRYDTIWHHEKES